MAVAESKKKKKKWTAERYTAAAAGSRLLSDRQTDRELHCTA